jgi:uncharacterized cupredoxin-like copper-binding protein
MRAAGLGAAAALVAVALVSGCTAAATGAPPGPGPEGRTVTLEVRHSRFSPAELDVRAGTTVRFVVRNADPIAHELIVGDHTVQDRHEQGTEAHHGDLPGEVSVPAGGTATTTYTFSRPGRVILGCHLPGHWDYGMRGVVKVR